MTRSTMPGCRMRQLAGAEWAIFVGVHGHACDYLLLQNDNLDELDSFSGTGAAHNLLAGDCPICSIRMARPW